MRALLLLVAFALAPACAGDSDVGPDGGASSCAELPLVGKWRTGTAGISEYEETYTADCRLETRNQPLVHGAPFGEPTLRAGIYAVEGQQLTTTLFDTGATTTVPFYVSAQFLVTNAFLPESSHSGIVGRWSRTAAGPATVSETYEFLADGTFTYARRESSGGADKESTESGTYTTHIVPDTFSLSNGKMLALVEDAALGEGTFGYFRRQ